MTYLLGYDLGQAIDYSALAVVRRDDDVPPTYVLSSLWRTRGLAYVGTPGSPGLVERTKTLLTTETALRNCLMAVDRTGVGRAVVDAFRAAGLPCALFAVTITAGQEMRQEGYDFFVPKKDLVAVAQALLSSGRLLLDSRLALAETLRTELKNFAVKITAAGNETFGEWRTGQHDDLVFAVALACWLGERFPSMNPADIHSGGGQRGGVFSGAGAALGKANVRRPPRGIFG